MKTLSKKMKTLFSICICLACVFPCASAIATDLSTFTWQPWQTSGGGAGITNWTYDLTVYNGDLIVGGLFTGVDGIAASGVASWNGSGWSALGSGVDGDYRAYGAMYSANAFTVYNNQLIVGGNFTKAGGASSNYIAAWDGTSWHALGSGMNNSVEVFTVYNSQLIAGGCFTTAGGAIANYIAAWDGTSWHALGGGMGSAVYALTVYNSQLIAGGCFTTAGGASANYIAAWDGSSWHTLGSGMNYQVQSLTVYNNQLIAGGWFTGAGGIPAAHIAAWDGTSWHALGSGVNNSINSFTVYYGQLIAGGQFTTAGGIAAAHIAAWDGGSWHALGSGMNGIVYPVTVYNSDLIAGGQFTTAGGISSVYLARGDVPLSSGGPVVVPNVVGMTQTAATTAITDATLVVGTVTQQYSNTVAAGLVISQNPVSGTSVNSGSSVNLVISLGPPVVTTVVPNVVGMTQASATTALNAATLIVGTVTQQYSNTVAAGLIISQNPVGGTSVNTGSYVNLVVSVGKPVVPNVVSMTQASATTAINSVTLIVGTVTQQYSNTVAAGLVISQNPVSGTSVNSGSSVNLVVSLGPPVVTTVVPNVVGMTQAAATTAINSVTLTVGTVAQQYSNTVAAGLIISQNPVGGTSVNTGSYVNLVVSVGKPVVPNVVSMTQASATTAINSVTLIVGTVTQQYSSTVAAGLVISQNPVSGTSVNSGSSVNLVVSLGPPVVTTVVPNVVGMTQAAATTAINSVTLIVGTVTQQYSSTVAAGLVISQNPVSGTSVNSGSSVNLVVSLGPPVVTTVVPNVVGMTQAAATAAITGANLKVGTVAQQFSNTVAAGLVISQNPVGDTVVNTGSLVNLIISKGKHGKK